MKISLLDCTLRDGGYINNWGFNRSYIRGICNNLISANIEFVELGFLDNAGSDLLNTTKCASIYCFNKILSNIKFNQTIPIAMIDYGHFDINKLPNADESIIKGIRVIFKKDKIDKALKFCNQIKNKGYLLFVQAVSITSYSEKEMIDYIKKINVLRPYAFSIVDTYGLLDNEELSKYFKIFEKYLNKDICIGYHGHNNFQLAFSNSINFIKSHTKHNLIVDSSLYGMGKSAGNCPTELLAMELNRKFRKKYNLNKILDLIDTYIFNLYLKYYWGYKYNFYLSSMNNCHPQYVKYLLDRKTISIDSINKIIKKIPTKYKLDFNEKLITKLYFDYQANKINDSETFNQLKRLFKDKVILAIGPGNSINNNLNKINKFISEKKPLIFSINFIPNKFNVNYCFVSNSLRYKDIIDKEIKANIKFIVSSNILLSRKYSHFVVDYSKLLNVYSNNSDNSLLLLLACLIRCNTKSVFLAGFDGFKGINDYFDNDYDFSSNSTYKIKSNEIIKENLKKAKKYIKINFLTNSLYE